MPTLYDSTPSGNCYKARLLLGQLAISYRTVAVDVTSSRARPPELLARNPSGRVPVLELDDGRVVVESNAILWHLADGTAFLSDDPWERTQTLRWLFFEQNQLEPNVAVTRYWISILGRPGDFAEGMEVRQRGGHVALEVLDRWLDEHTFFVGECYTIADIALFAYTHVADEGGFELGSYPRISAWLDRVRSRPGFVPMSAAGGSPPQ